MSIAADFTFAASSAEFRLLLAACNGRNLTAFEVEFVGSMQTRRKPPTDKQWAVLRRIAAGTPNYEAIASVALQSLPEILARWIPDGKQTGHEFIARNPKRADRSVGSFTVNTNTGRWADFATGDRGGDLISLAAFLFDLAQPEAARRVAAMLGLGEVTHD